MLFFGFADRIESDTTENFEMNGGKRQWAKQKKLRT